MPSDILDDRVLKGRIALITGASRGLGKAMALELGSAGAAVFVADIAQEAQVRALQQRVGERFDREPTC